jgi:hypothetical protein
MNGEKHHGYQGGEQSRQHKNRFGIKEFHHALPSFGSA